MSISAKPPSRTAEQFVVRFPDGMRDRIAEAAKANNRSMNAEIVSRLEESFAELTKEQLQMQLDRLQTLCDIANARLGHAHHELHEARTQAADHQNRLYVLLDASGYPISWEEIRAYTRAVRDAGNFNPSDMEVTVVTPDMVSSSVRAKEAVRIADRLREIGKSGPYDPDAIKDETSPTAPRP